MPGKERYELAVQHYREKYGDDNAEFLMEMEQAWITRYSNAAYVDLGLSDTEELKAYTKECADFLGWGSDILAGDPRLLIDFLEGNWNNEDFLVVEPGQMVVASHDDGVLTTKDAPAE